jgi:hypothetical protein
VRYTRNLIFERRELLIERYEKVANKKYDPSNGTAQIPKDNMKAAVVYGAIDELTTLLSF